MNNSDEQMTHNGGDMTQEFNSWNEGEGHEVRS